MRAGRAQFREDADKQWRIGRGTRVDDYPARICRGRSHSRAQRTGSIDWERSRFMCGCVRACGLFVSFFVSEYKGLNLVSFPSRRMHVAFVSRTPERKVFLT